MEEKLTFSMRDGNFLYIRETRVFGFIHIYIYTFMLPTANIM